MILEGKVQAEIGKENLIFESGPFTFFGTRALIPLPGIIMSCQQQLILVLCMLKDNFLEIL